MSGGPAWARRTPTGWVLSVRVQPGSARSAVVGTIGDELKVRAAAPANEGKANAELVRFLARELGVPRGAVRIARELGVPRGAVRIARGETARSKVVEVDDPAGRARLPDL